ncbi:hypothetical protein BpHYR1_001942 [Brachionus plicatilis]|uniref:Uncharacterized protein n=1 Tax=Brachionus plicatilis TaxID=10195 RepID=A0A3M7QWD5_BRAPC|nr:hypothetical protein BpHYR1_001942 [Brachionus plicatilis]
MPLIITTKFFKFFDERRLQEITYEQRKSVKSQQSYFGQILNNEYFKANLKIMIQIAIDYKTEKVYEII